MISQVFRSIWLAVAIAISGSVLVSARAEDSEKDLPALAAALKDAKVKLEDGLKASEREGKPSRPNSRSTTGAPAFGLHDDGRRIH
jgi:hypothetical protein